MSSRRCMRPAACNSRSLNDCARRLIPVEETPRQHPPPLLRGDRFRIRLQSDFNESGVACAAKSIENSRKQSGLKKARSAAAQVHGVDRLPGREVRACDLAADGIGVGLMAVARNNPGMKIAVGATRLTERYLNVYAQ